MILQDLGTIINRELGNLSDKKFPSAVNVVRKTNFGILVTI